MHSAHCSNPGVPAGGRRIGNNFRHAKQVSFQCQKSLKIQGPRRIICYDGSWSDRKPKCLPPSQVKGNTLFICLSFQSFFGKPSHQSIHRSIFVPSPSSIFFHLFSMALHFKENAPSSSSNKTVGLKIIC